MSGWITADGANYFLDLFAARTQPVEAYYVALINGSQPGISAKGDELDEPEFAEYARGYMENLSGNWFGNQGLILNQFAITFPILGQSWGTLRYWALCDAPTGGRVLAAGDFPPFEGGVGDQIVLPAGIMGIGLDLDIWTSDT